MFFPSEIKRSYLELSKRNYLELIQKGTIWKYFQEELIGANPKGTIEWSQSLELTFQGEAQNKIQEEKICGVSRKKIPLGIFFLFLLFLRMLLRRNKNLKWIL